MSDLKQIETVEQWRNEPEEYKEACCKIVISHAINELFGTQV